MDGSQTLNFNQYSSSITACLKSTYRFGETFTTNICSGATFTIPWGGVDWVLVILGLSILGGIAILLLLWLCLGLISIFLD